jgi:hypothetical protein
VKTTIESLIIVDKNEEMVARVSMETREIEFMRPVSFEEFVQASGELHHMLDHYGELSVRKPKKAPKGPVAANDAENVVSMEDNPNFRRKVSKVKNPVKKRPKRKDNVAKLFD